MEIEKETSLTNTVIKRIRFIVLVAFIIFVVLLIGGSIYFFMCLTPVNKKTDATTEFILDSGLSISQVAEKLKSEGLIKNVLVFKIYVRLNDYNNFQAGTYNLSKNMNVDDIITSFVTGSNAIQDTVIITFVEGKRFPYYINKIAENFDYTYDEVMAYATSEEFLNKTISNYWFIDEDILNKDLYYPLEGYLFPDTYEFKVDATIDEILNKMLTEMKSKLDTYQEEINLSGKKVSSLLTLASMVELEAVEQEDRKDVAGVFSNRLAIKMTLGSDVTTYYAVNKEMTEKLTMSDLNSCNAYNTRGTCVSGLPVGPICSPSLGSIVAAITPSETECYYFIADSNNKVYCSKTLEEQNKKIANLRKQGLWPE